MTNTLLDTQASRSLVILITISSTEDRHRYCNDKTSITVGGNVFLPLPGLEIDLPENTGTANEEPGKMRVPVSVAFPPFHEIASGYPVPSYQVKVEETSRETPDDDLFELYFGTVEGVCERRANILTVPLSSFKLRIAEIRSGVPALSQCPWKLGHPNTCKLDVRDLVVSKQLLARGSNDLPTLVRFDDFDTSTQKRMWIEGYLEYLGVRIAIRRVRTGGILELRRVPPPTWYSLDPLPFISINPGCDGDISRTCGPIYNNVSENGAVGLEMPTRNPQYQV